MIRRFSVIFALSAACLGMSQALAANESSDKDMEARIERLEAQLAEQNAGEADLKNEGRTRYDGQLSSMLRKDGESFSFELQSMIQTRFELNDVNDSAGSYAKEEDSAGFRLNRIYTGMKGHVYNPAFTYDLLLSWNNEGVDDIVKRAVFGYVPSDSYGFYMGREKVPFNMQETTFAENLQFMERSAANEAFNMDYGHGGWAAGSPLLGDSGAMIRYAAGIFSGQYTDLRQSDTAANPQNEDFAWTYVGRVEFLPFGSSGSILGNESDLRSDADKESFLGMFGLGFNYGRDRGSNRTVGTTGIASPFEADVLNTSIDFRLHAYGFSVNGGVFGRFVRFDDESDDTAAHPGHLEDFGWYAQVGYNLNLEEGQLEFIGRISAVDYDEFQDGAGGTATGSDAMGNDVFEFTVGSNFRVYGDDLRFSFDATHRTEQQPNVENDIPSWTLRLGVQVRF